MSTVKVENVNDVDGFKDVDIHLILTQLDTGKKIFISVKGDTFDNTPNYCFETVRDIKEDLIGSIMYAKSDFIFYYFVKSKKLHILPTQKIQQYIIEKGDRLRTFTVKLDEGYTIRTAVCKLITRMAVQRNFGNEVQIMNLNNVNKDKENI